MGGKAIHRKIKTFIFRKVEEQRAKRQILKQTEVGRKNLGDKQAM